MNEQEPRKDLVPQEVVEPNQEPAPTPQEGEKEEVENFKFAI